MAGSIRSQAHLLLDEGQRIKNWESKTSNLIRSLESPFRLVLSGRRWKTAWANCSRSLGL
nr:SNF2-related protein [Roseimaritima ulvae]